MSGFKFGDANESQREAISTVDGPVLIIAGPGTGKTYTLVQRALYLIEERGVSPESIFIATFTEKAAMELETRISNELDNRGIMANINDMYVGTFHSICLRILDENLTYTSLRRNYRKLDDFEQQYTIFQNINEFTGIQGAGNFLKGRLSEGIAHEKQTKRTEYVMAMSESFDRSYVRPEDIVRALLSSFWNNLHSCIDNRNQCGGDELYSMYLDTKNIDYNRQTQVAAFVTLWWPTEKSKKQMRQDPHFNIPPNQDLGLCILLYVANFKTNKYVHLRTVNLCTDGETIARDYIRPEKEIVWRTPRNGSRIQLLMREIKRQLRLR